MTSGQPDLSVIIAAYCAEFTLGASVNSAVSQVGVDVEVLVVDDRSPDATHEVARRLESRDPRVRTFRNATNGGPAVARNAALDHARGDWVAVLDADDAFAPERSSRLIALADAEGADVVLGNLQEVDEGGVALGDRFIPTPRAPEALSVEAFVERNLSSVGSHTYGYLKPVFRRSFLETHGIRYDPTLRNGEDFHVIMACFLAGARVWFSPEPLYRYTRRSGSISHRADLSHLAALADADARLADRADNAGSLGGLLRRRQGDTQDLLVAETVMRALKAGNMRNAARAVLHRPQAMSRVGQQLVEALRKRL